MSRDVGIDVLAPFAGSVRRRRLAGDNRAGSYARGIARRRQYAFMREIWLAFAVALMVAVAVLLVAARFIANDFARGVVVGGGLAAVAGAMWNWIVQVTGTAPTMMGDLGEQWTASELRKLRRSGWVVVNHVTLRTRDIDHVLIGSGGVFAVETKWSAQPWTWSPIDPRIVDAARSARGHAHDLGLWHDLKSLGVGDVHSVVFLWGDGARGIPPGAEIEGTAIVTEKTAGLWRTQLGDGRLMSSQVEAAWTAVDAQCRRRDALEAESAPVPASLGEWLARLIFSVASASAGVLAVTSVASAGLAWPLALAWWALMLAVGVAVSRIAAVRYLGVAWAGGVIATGLVAAIAVVASLL